MVYEPRKPQKLGAETREAERAVLREIEETAWRAVSICPECIEKETFCNVY
jgi:hypothetical protein